MKWIGQHIWDYYTRFRNDVYLEDLSTTTETNMLIADSDGKVSKRTMSSLTTGKVTVTDSTANTEFPVVFHDESDGLLDDTGSFTYNPSVQTLTMISSVSNLPGILLENTNTDNKPPQIKFLKDKGAAGADGDYTGSISFYGDNSAQEETNFGVIRNRIVTAQDTDEASKMEIYAACSDGSTSNLQNIITGTGHGTSNIVDISLGYGATSTTTVAGNLTVTSDLTVSGTTTTINTTNLNVEDKNITLNYNASGDTSGTADGAGITIQDAVDASNDATFNWVAASDIWHLSHPVQITSAVGHGRPGFDIQHAQVDRNALSISASNTTADIFNIDGGALTTASFIKLTNSNSLTNYNNLDGIFGDWDFTKTGNAGDGETYRTTGLNLNITDSASSNHANSNIDFTGMSLAVDSANTNGGNSNTGLRLDVTDATTNLGIKSSVTDGGAFFQDYSTANSADYSTWTTTTNGATTIATVDGDASLAHLTFNADGDIVITPGSNKEIKLYTDDNGSPPAAPGVSAWVKGESNPYMRMLGEVGGLTNFVLFGQGGGAGASDYFMIEADANGNATLSTADPSGSNGAITLAPDGDLLPRPVSGNTSFSNSASGKPLVSLTTTNTTKTTSAELQFKKNAADTEDGEVLGKITFYGEDEGNNNTQFAEIVASISESDEGDEAGILEFKVAESDSTTTAMTTGLKLEGEHATDGEIDVTIGAGVGSTTTITGDLTVSGGDIYGPTDGNLDIESDADLNFAIDTDNDATNSFTWSVNGVPHGGRTIMSLDEAGALQVGSWASTTPKITIHDVTADANGPELILSKARDNGASGIADGQDNDVVGDIQFNSYDDGTPSAQTYANIKATIADATSGQEAGKLSFYVAEYDGTSTTAGLVLDGDTNADGEIDVTIGAGAASMTTIAGDLDIDGDTVTSAGNLTLDTVGDISLDAHTAKDIFFKENGTERFHFHLDSTPTMEVTGNFDIEPTGGLEFKSGKNMVTTYYDFHSSTFENDYNNDVGSGKILKYSPGSSSSLNGSECYYLHTDGTWVQARRDDVANGAKQLLGVGLGGDPQTVGVLIEGFIRIASTEILNVPGSGAVDGLPIYVGGTAGHFDFNPPTTSNHYVRIAGYAIDDDGGDVLMYFNPDKTWVKIA